MNWEAIGAVSELIGAMAVFSSLIYVAIQIRYNTKTQQAATYHAMMSAKNQVNLQISAVPDSSRILLEGSLDYRVLEIQDRHRFNLLMRSIVGVAEDIFIQYSKGLADQEDHELNLAQIRDLLKQPGIKEWVSRNGHLFRKAFMKELVTINT